MASVGGSIKSVDGQKSFLERLEIHLIVKKSNKPQNNQYSSKPKESSRRHRGVAAEEGQRSDNEGYDDPLLSEGR